MVKRAILTLLVLSAGALGFMAGRENGLRRAPRLGLSSRFGRRPIQTDRIFLSGNVSAATGPVTLTLNSEVLLVTQSSESSWGTIVDVTPGLNRYEIVARDGLAAASSLVVDVTVEEEEPYFEQFAPRLLLLGIEEESHGRVWSEFFETDLGSELRKTKRFRVLDRSQLVNVLQEHSLQAADLNSIEARLRVGRLLVADNVLAFRSLTRDDRLRIALEAADVVTQEIVWSAVYESAGLAPDDVEFLAAGIALDIRRLFGQLAAQVLDTVEWPEVYIDRGSDGGVCSGMRAFAIENGAPVCKGLVVEVQERVTRVEFEESDSAAFLKPGTRVLLAGFLGN